MALNVLRILTGTHEHESPQPELIVWVCLRCDRAFGEDDKALEHHTKKKHRLSKRRVE